MLNIINKIKAVESIFTDLEKEIVLLKINSGLRCPEKCCYCCKTVNIECSILEFLPMAYYLHSIGLSNYYLNLLEQKNTNDICIFSTNNIDKVKLSGCKYYNYRGLICRLFGFSGKKDKYNNTLLITCQNIKNTFKTEFDILVEKISQGLEIPILRNYYLMLYGIDYSLSDKMYPINQAIKAALNIIVFNDYYKKAS